jgi:hypothetical protein
MVNIADSIAPRVCHVGGERKRKRATDSVQFRRVGRKAAETTPFVDINPDTTNNDPVVNNCANENTSEHTTVNPSRNRPVLSHPLLRDPYSSSSESDEDNDIYNYLPLDPEKACSSNVNVYMEKINNTFLDIDDNIRFRIIEVCEGRKHGTRGGNNAILFYKYVEVDEPEGEVNYTQCRELLNSSWAKWDPTIAASNRAARLSARGSIRKP